jgi:Sulfotransferase domain
MPIGESTEFDGLSEGTSWPTQPSGFRVQGLRYGIKRPNLLGLDGAAERLAAADCRYILVVLRDPIDRTLSAYFHYMVHGFLPVKPPDEGIALLFTRSMDREWPRSPEVLSFGQYARHIRHWLPLYRRDQMFLCTHDGLLEKPKEVISDALAFLDVPVSVENIDLTRQVNRSVYSLGRVRFLQAMNPMMFRYFADRTRMAPRFPHLGKLVYGIDRGILARWMPNEKPEISDSTKSRLLGYFAHDRQDLETMFGIDCSHWR